MAFLGRENKRTRTRGKVQKHETQSSLSKHHCRWDNPTLMLRCSCLKYACWWWWAKVVPVTSEDWSTRFPSGQKQIQQDNKNNSRTCKNLTEYLLTFPVSYLPLLHFFYIAPKWVRVPMLWCFGCIHDKPPPPFPPDEDDTWNCQCFSLSSFHWDVCLHCFSMVQS